MSSSVIKILGIILGAVGVALGLVGLISPTRLGGMFLTLDTAATLIAGGVVSFGLGSVISALEALSKSGFARANAPQTGVSTVPEMPPAMRPRIDEIMKSAANRAAPSIPPGILDELPPANVPEFRAATKEVSAPASASAISAAAASLSLTEESIPDTSVPPSSSVAETINALEKAKADMRAAFGGGVKPNPQPPIPSVAIPPPADEPEDDEEVVAEAEPEADIETGGLYVVEEKTIRGRPARILSDGTVEAETDEGWMRFENLEHLNEYLDG